MQKKLNPWDIGPTELINFALERMHGGTDFDKRLSFLVLDVGVETLFKAFLSLPDSISHAQTSFSKRQAAATGSFHDLITGIRDAAPERVKTINLDHVHYYHEIRNTLYHQGNTVVAVRIDLLSDYAKLAVELLRELLGVDLSEDLIPPEPEPKTVSDPVVDSAEVVLPSGRYRIERLKSKTIRGIDVDRGNQVETVKPLLREIIREHSLQVSLTLNSGREKNTRTLGREVIKALKPSAWHSLAPGQGVSPDKLDSTLAKRTLEGRTDKKSRGEIKSPGFDDQEEYPRVERSFETVYVDLQSGLEKLFPPEVSFHKPRFDIRGNRMSIYLDQMSGSHYEICFRRAYTEVALHFQSSPARSLARRQVFDPHLSDLSHELGYNVLSGPLENKGWMRVWIKLDPETAISIKTNFYIDLFARFIGATFPILKQAYKQST